MLILYYLCFFFLGASIASFLNATIYRIEKRYKCPTIFTKGSHCENCNHELTWYELIPVFGYIFIGGKCPKCHKKINPYYPISELILGIFFSLFLYLSLPWYLFILLISLFILSTYDFKDSAVDKLLTWIFFGICVVFFFLFRFEISNIFLPLLTICFFMVLNLFKKSFGTADIIIIFSLGILLSTREYLIFFWLTIFIALFYSIIKIVREKQTIKNARIPFLPFMSIGFCISIVWGSKLFEILLKLMGI